MLTETKQNKDSLFERVKDMFSKGYKYHKGIKYVFEKKDNTAIGQIISKLHELYPEHNTEQMFEDVRSFFSAAMNSTEYIKTYFTPARLNQEFNPIMAIKIKNDELQTRRKSEIHHKDEKDFNNLGGLVNSILSDTQVNG